MWGWFARAPKCRAPDGGVVRRLDFPPSNYQITANMSSGERETGTQAPFGANSSRLHLNANKSRATVNLDTLEPQQLAQVKKQLDEELDHLTSSFSQLHGAQGKFKECLRCVNSRSEASKSESWVPFTLRGEATPVANGKERRCANGANHLI